MQLKCDKNQVRRVHQGVIINLVVPQAFLVSNPPVRALPVRLSAANNADHCVHNLPFDWLPDNRTSYQGIKCRSLTTPWHALAIKNAEWGAKITRKITGLLLFSPPSHRRPWMWIPHEGKHYRARSFTLSHIRQINGCLCGCVYYN